MPQTRRTRPASVPLQLTGPMAAAVLGAPLAGSRVAAAIPRADRPLGSSGRAELQHVLADRLGADQRRTTSAFSSSSARTPRYQNETPARGNRAGTQCLLTLLLYRVSLLDSKTNTRQSCAKH